MATKVSELMKQAKSKQFPGTSFKFRNTKSGPRVSSMKSPKFGGSGSKYNLK